MKKLFCHPKLTILFTLLILIPWISHGVNAKNPPEVSTVQKSDSTVIDSILAEYYSRWSLEVNALDSKGNNHGLLIGNPSFVNENMMENDFALSFDGVDDNVAVSDDPSLEGMEEFCFSFWVKPDGDPSGIKMVVGKEMAYRVLIVPGGGYTWVIATENNPWYSEGTSISGTRKLILDTWNHIIAGYDGNQSYLYLNGQLDTTSGPLTGRIIDNSSPLTFAKGNDTNVGFFDGTLDDVRYYRTMLSDSSIQNLYELYPLVDTTTAPPEDPISGVQWKVTEIDFSSMKAYTNGFYDVNLDVVFKHSDGTEFTVPAFWNGGNHWKVRFAPSLTGEWSYRTICSDESNMSLHELRDTFACEPYHGDLALYQHGFVKTTPDKRYFTYADDIPFFYLGDTHWNIPANSYENFKTIIDKRVEQKFTVIQSEPLSTGYTLWNGFSESDLLGFARLDDRFAYVAEQGLVHANAQLFFVSELGNKWENYPDAYLEKLCRYWVARYSAYPVMWTTAQECDNDYYVERGTHDWWDVNTNPWKTVANYIHQYDPYKHPQTAHMEATFWTVASQSSFRDLPGHSWYAAQWSPKKNGQLDFSVPRDFWNNGQGKPSVNYEGLYDYLWTNHYGARQQGWAAYLNGMYGHGYGAIDIWLYNSSYDMETPTFRDGITITVEDKHTKWDVSLEFPSAYQMGHMHDFFDSIAWWKLIPRFDDPEWFSNDGSWYSLASNDNDLYVAYFYNVSPFVTSRSTGTLKNLDDEDAYRAQWYNPREGNYTLISSSVQSSQGQWIIPEKPDTLDWVLLLTNDGVSLSDKMLGRWRLESNALDELGNNNGTIGGDAVFSDTGTREGEYSLVLDGTDDHLIIPDHPSMSDLNAFCVAFWMRSDGFPDDSLIILEKGEAFRLVLDHDGRLRSTLATVDNPWDSPATIVQTSVPLEAGTWYYIAMGYDGSSSTIYINGKLAGSSGDILSGLVLNNTQDLLIAASAEAGWERLAGQVDDVILFSDMPDANDILGLYAAYIPSAVIIAAESIADFDGDGVEQLTLDATNSSDPDGTILSYAWCIDDQPSDSGAVIVTELSLGKHTVILTIRDNNGIASTDSTVVEITGSEFSRWKLEGNARDFRGNNPGILSGNPVFIMEEVMEDTFALSFDGIDDHVIINDNASLDGMDQFSYSFWVKTDELPSENCMVLGKEETYRVLLSPTGRFTWAIATENNPWSSPGTAITGYGIIELDQWDHLVVGYDGTHLYIYRNGHLDIKSNPLSGRIVDNSHPLVFAKGNSSNADHFKGVLDDVRYFTYMLSDSSVQRLFGLYPLIDTISSEPVDKVNRVMGTGSLGRVLLFPNPSSHQVTIKGLPKDATISLYSLQGEQLYADMSPKSTEYTLDISHFAPGIYILKFSYKGSLAIRKLIISP